MTDEVRIQAEVGGAARIDPGNGVQRPGYMIRDFTLNSSSGEEVRISSFRGSDNLVLVFPGHSKAMRAFLEDAATHSRDLANQQAAVIAVLPDDGKEHAVPNQGASQILELYDETLSVHRRSGAVDEDGRLVPVIYVTDRFGEIVATHLVEGDASPPSLEEILRSLEFINHQCPECEPPEWPR